MFLLGQNKCISVTTRIKAFKSQNIRKFHFLIQNHWSFLRETHSYFFCLTFESVEIILISVLLLSSAFLFYYYTVQSGSSYQSVDEILK